MRRNMRTKSGGAPKLRGWEDNKVQEKEGEKKKPVMKKANQERVVFQRPEFKEEMVITYCCC